MSHRTSLHNVIRRRTIRHRLRTMLVLLVTLGTIPYSTLAVASPAEDALTDRHISWI
jgi:hypothetical protein